MSVSKALQHMDKQDLKCKFCSNRFHQPKTLECMHTFCLECIQDNIRNDDKMECLICDQEHDLTEEDIEQLTLDIMISQLLDYVIKTEEQKPTKCSFCDNEPAYHCSTCQLYLCKAQCFKCHEKIPASKDHPLYTLDVQEQDGSSEKITKCPAHSKSILEFCPTCNKSACKQCCCSHRTLPILPVVDEFNKDATRVVRLARRIKWEYKEKYDCIDKELTVCRTEIEIRKETIEKLMKESKKLKEEEVYYDRLLEGIGSKLTKVTNMITSINIIMSQPEETKTLTAHKKTINVLGSDFDFIPGTFPCNTPKCKICPHINRSSSSITGPNMKVFTVEEQFTCTSTNVVYAVTCAKCPDGVYIGHTGREFRARMKEHITEFKDGENSGIGEHFFLHEDLDFQVAVLTCIQDKKKRKTKETDIIEYFDCVEMGLNKIY